MVTEKQTHTSSAHHWAVVCQKRLGKCLSAVCIGCAMHTTLERSAIVGTMRWQQYDSTTVPSATCTRLVSCVVWTTIELFP